MAAIKKPRSGEHPAVKLLHAQIDEMKSKEIRELESLNARLRHLTDPPGALDENADTEPAPPSSTDPVVHVPPSDPLPDDPPAPETKKDE